MRKSGGEPMSCGYSPTPPAACAWSAHSPSKPTKTGSKPTATSIWTNCASRRKPNYAKPHDQHHDRQFAELDAHNPRTPKNAGERGGQRESTGWSGRSEAQPSEPRPVYSRCWGEGGRNVLAPLNKRHAGQRRHLVPEIRARDLARHVDRHRMAKTDRKSTRLNSR